VAENPLPTWLAETAPAAVVVRLDSIDAEAQGNLWTIALSAALAASVSAAEIEAIIRSIAAARARTLAAEHAGPMLLYCWHDEQAGQLRLSMVSASHGSLPFECGVMPASDLGAIVRSFLGSPFLEGVPWAELRPAGPNDVSIELSAYTLSVWIARVP
jgi:hypothetical protein